jgi:hypothetical protein
MSSWANKDRYQDAPLWALARVNKAPTTANMGAAGSGKLFNNASANNLISGITIGLFNYTDGEAQSGEWSRIGWDLKTARLWR